MESKKPIKRNKAIVEFSKDHHFGLLLVWKIREGLKKSIDLERIKRYIIHFFEKDLTNHFREEEELLFIQLESDNPLRTQAESEHKEIKQLFDEIMVNQVNSNLLEKFADILDKHIRFEEKKLFNYLQKNLSKRALQEISSSVKPREHKADDTWSDVFWK